MKRRRWSTAGRTVTGLAAVVAAALLLGAAGCVQHAPPQPESSIERNRHDEEEQGRGTSGTNIKVELNVCTQVCAYDRARCNHGEACGCQGNCRGACGGSAGIPHGSEIGGGLQPR